jgi:exoribonuclease-2
VQTGGKVRMSTAPQPHEGLGVKQYAWSSSPLRRYVDLLNQWQLIACLQGETPPFAARSDALFAAMRDFELTYSAYAEFQRSMERYWCLRWLRQQGLDTIEATIVAARTSPGSTICLWCSACRRHRNSSPASESACASSRSTT